MSKIKSFSVGDGDMFYIKHDTDNFSIIDCYLSDENKVDIIKDIKHAHLLKGVTRVISTHPDQDHIQGLKYLDDNIDILNFYCIKNNVTKEDETDDFKHYCELRDSDKAFYIKKDCFRRWMNRSSEERGSAGINILWPDTENEYFKEALKSAEKGESPNNTSAIIKYSLKNGVTALWMGDLETEFMENIEDEVEWSEVDILFAPHHGRDSGKVPESILKKLNPKIIVIGEAPTEGLNYYADYNTITQNSAGDITFDCITNKVHIFVSNPDYSVDFLDNEHILGDDNYIGTLNL
jgi:beta-lactamase superfamily II metal-dependent hydrolase